MRDGKESITQFNFGIALLKVWLSFIVITCHFYKGIGILAFPMRTAVPAFVAISFLFQEISYREKGKPISTKRTLRFIVPGILWGGVYYIASVVLHTGASVKDLLCQLLLGSDHLINPTLWYLYDMAIMLFLFMKFQKYDKNTYTIIRVLIIIICVILQYTGVNYKFFICFQILFIILLADSLK